MSALSPTLLSLLLRFWERVDTIDISLRERWTTEILYFWKRSYHSHSSWWAVTSAQSSSNWAAAETTEGAWMLTQPIKKALLQHKQQRQKFYYGRNAAPLQPLYTGESARVQQKTAGGNQ